MDLSLLMWAGALLLVCIGLAGLVFPALPGAPLVYAGLVMAAWAEDFEYVGILTLSILGVLTLLTYAVDLAAGAFGAKKFGASPRAVAGAVIGAIVGIFFGLPGVLLGPFVGAAIAELTHAGEILAASKAGFGATVGLVLGAIAKLALAFSMIGIFIVVRFLGV